MFRSSAQRAQVCRALTQSLSDAPLWTPEGPTAQAVALAADARMNLSGTDRAVLSIAFWLWDGTQTPPAGRVLELLDAPRLRLLGSLLIALADGASAIDRWIRNNGGPAGEA